MWVEGGDIHDELLDRLGGVLAPPEDLALTPSAAELEALAAAVAARWPEGATPGDGAPVVSPLRSGRSHRLRRLGSSAWRAGSVAAALVLVSGSAAAAANGGVPLPRPVRVVAYTVGLPVDSPALDDTNQHIKELKKAVKANDKPKAEATVRRLRTDLAKVPADEKKVAVPKVEAAIEVAKPLIQAPAPTTTTTVPPSSSTTAPAPASSTTATSVEEEQKEQEKPAATTTTTAPPNTTTTEPPTTTTTAPETDETPSGDQGTSTGDGGSIGSDPGPTTSTTVPETTTTTAPPPDETTTTTTTESSTTTTTAPPPQPASVDGS